MSAGFTERAPRSGRAVRRIVLVAASLHMYCRPALAQRTTRENVNAWVTLNGELILNKKWALDWDFPYRRSGPLKEMQQILPRASVRYTINPRVRFNVGYAFSETWPYGKLPAAHRFPEHRLFEALQLAQDIGRVALTHRYRIEQRWTGRVATVDGTTGVQDWVRTNRARYRAQATVPLQGPTTEPGEFYWTVGDEVFLNWGRNIQFNVFDQNRVLTALGKRLSKGLRVEVGYLEQLIEKSNGKQLERNHTLLFALYTSTTLLP